MKESIKKKTTHFLRVLRCFSDCGRTNCFQGGGVRNRIVSENRYSITVLFYGTDRIFAAERTVPPVVCSSLPYHQTSVLSAAGTGERCPAQPDWRLSDGGKIYR